jgi:hypothetical protein
MISQSGVGPAAPFPIHPASLVDPVMHSPHTLRLISLKITEEIIGLSVIYSSYLP